MEEAMVVLTAVSFVVLREITLYCELA